MAKTVRQELEELGWKFEHECQVCKTLKHYYSHPDHKGYTIIVKPRANIFQLEKDNRNVFGPFWNYEIKSKLNAYQWPPLK